MKTILLLVTSLLVAGNWVFGEEEPDLDDPKVREKIFKEALSHESLEERGPNGEKLFYQAGKQTPYTGWGKEVYDNGKVKKLGSFKDGKGDGLWTWWHDNGQKLMEGHCKDGKMDGQWTVWDEEGKVVKETRYKDGEEVKE